MSIPAILYNIAICNLVPVILFIIARVKAKKGKAYRGFYIAGIVVGVLWLLPQVLLLYSLKGRGGFYYYLFDTAFFFLAIIFTLFGIYSNCRKSKAKYGYSACTLSDLGIKVMKKDVIIGLLIIYVFFYLYITRACYITFLITRFTVEHGYSPSSLVGFHIGKTRYSVFSFKEGSVEIWPEGGYPHDYNFMVSAIVWLVIMLLCVLFLLLLIRNNVKSNSLKEPSSSMIDSMEQTNASVSAQTEVAKQDIPLQDTAHKFVCTNCGNFYSKWVRKCTHCGSEGQILTTNFAQSINTSLKELPATESQGEKTVQSPQNGSILFCRKCGTAQLADALFCRKCGFRIITDDTAIILENNSSNARLVAEERANDSKTPTGDNEKTEQQKNEPIDITRQEAPVSLKKDDNLNQKTEIQADPVASSAQKVDTQSKFQSLHPSASIISQLRELKTLLDENLITEDDYNAKKKQILGL